MMHATYFNDTGRTLMVHAGSSGVAFKAVPPTHYFCIEVPDGRYSFFKIWGDDVILITTVSEPVCPPPPLPKPAKGVCFLCERPRKSNWHYEDETIWIATCPFCGNIVVASKTHGNWTDTQELLRLLRRGMKRYPDMPYRFDGPNRGCFPGHPHLHLLPKESK